MAIIGIYYFEAGAGFPAIKLRDLPNDPGAILVRVFMDSGDTVRRAVSGPTPGNDVFVPN